MCNPARKTLSVHLLWFQTSCVAHWWARDFKANPRGASLTLANRITEIWLDLPSSRWNTINATPDLIHPSQIRQGFHLKPSCLLKSQNWISTTVNCSFLLWEYIKMIISLCAFLLLWQFVYRYSTARYYSVPHASMSEADKNRLESSVPNTFRCLFQ